jgi:hypothetical protein
MEIYKDMLEKLKYHKQIIMNAFIRNNYYPSNEEVNAMLAKVNARMSLFESYISKPGSYFNFNEINYCFEMIHKDIETLYTVLESILTNEYVQLKLHVESTLLELEAKAEHFQKRCKEEANSSSLGITIMFQSNNWNVTTKDQMTILDLGEYEFIEGSEIACFANINNVEKQEVMFSFDCGDPKKNFHALPYNLYDNIIYKIPGDVSINKKDIEIDITAIVNNSLHLKYDIDMLNKYKIMGGKNYMTVTPKGSNKSRLVEFPDINNYAYFATEDCYIEFYIVDGNVNSNSYLEYNFNMAPNHCNFSLQDGTIKVDSDIKRIYIDAQMGLLVSFRKIHGEIYAECLDPIILDKNTLLYNGNLEVRDILIREYVRTDLVKYNIKVYIDSIEDIIDDIESIYIKELN